jgi:type IV pilus assembly protein PilB
MRHFRKTVNKQLGEILIERGVLSRSKLEEVLAFQKEKGVLFGEALVQLKMGTEEDVVQALTCQYGFPYLPLANYEIAPEVVATVPRSVCKQYCLVPIDKIGRSLTLAMVNPLNVQALEDVEKVTDCSVQAFVSTATEINSAINRYYETR